ncbi:hypothetical protein M413DRAFT_433200 [Hebeloma cylindrosporum]|uniref:Ras-associating domain-containing protein n=1 Tax=Hebeloma cylindrosporum TaxID=76867 RepID=A0A0C3CIJ7_HEBCY|nr:hypothetical protein M413DRAFT_433200 [Hebeloma cylindrosporum h7]
MAELSGAALGQKPRKLHPGEALGIIPTPIPPSNKKTNRYRKGELDIDSVVAYLTHLRESDDMPKEILRVRGRLRNAFPGFRTTKSSIRTAYKRAGWDIGELSQLTKKQTWLLVEVAFNVWFFTQNTRYKGIRCATWLDSEALKSLGVTSIGHRLAILKHIYQVKLAHNVPIEAHQYAPPCELIYLTTLLPAHSNWPAEPPGCVENINLQIHSIVQDQAQRLTTLEENNWNLNNTLQSFMEELEVLRPPWGQPDEVLSLTRRRLQKSPTKVDPPESRPNPSPKQIELIPNYYSNAESPEGFKIGLEDPMWKVLPAALKKYRINNEDWQSYAMLVCYGPSGNRVERCLTYDEKPLRLFQKLENAKKDPVFALKHIKDIRSPIADAGTSSH